VNEGDYKQAVVVDLGTDPLLEQVEATVPLRIFRDYLDAYRAVARDRAIAVKPRGRTVLPDHVSYGFYVNLDADQGFEVVREVSWEVGKSTVKPLVALAKSLARLPLGVEAAVVMPRAGLHQALSAGPVVRPQMFHEVTTRRVEVERTGGLATPTIRVRDRQSRDRYTLATDMATAQAAGQVLYRRADVRMRIRRLVATTQIVDGVVLNFHPVDDRVPTLAEAQSWFGRRFADRP
jgi:hypothetical protein